MRSGQWLVARNFFKLPDALKQVGDQLQRPALRCRFFWGQAADV
jgi:hypothetical protein